MTFLAIFIVTNHLMHFDDFVGSIMLIFKY